MNSDYLNVHVEVIYPVKNSISFDFHGFPAVLFGFVFISSDLWQFIFIAWSFKNENAYCDIHIWWIQFLILVADSFTLY